MSVASKSLPCPAVDLSEKDRINGEIDKIFLSARLVGVSADYMPNLPGRKHGLVARSACPLEDISGPQTHVYHETLMGHLFFRCYRDKIQKIRIPGMNAEWQNFKDLGQEHVDVPMGGLFTFGPHKFEVHASSGPDYL